VSRQEEDLGFSKKFEERKRIYCSIHAVMRFSNLLATVGKRIYCSIHAVGLSREAQDIMSLFLHRDLYKEMTYTDRLS